MYSELYLRLEPLGLERVAAAARSAGHDVRLLDLQIFRHRDYARELETFRPEAVGFSLNYAMRPPPRPRGGQADPGPALRPRPRGRPSHGLIVPSPP